jgi:hypothetical protein
MDFMAALIDLASKLGPWSAANEHSIAIKSAGGILESIRVQHARRSAIRGVKMKTHRKIKRRRRRKLHGVAALRVG